jgi:signal transduction histidine kinase
VRRRLLLSYLAVAVLVLALLEIPLAISYADNERSDLADKVQRDAVALSTLVEDSLEHGAAISPTVRRVLTDYTSKTQGRAIVVDAKGRKLVDSAPTGSEDFASRPEIASALSGHIAVGRRHSQTLGTDLLYVAVPVASSGVVHGAVRITYPMSAVNARIHRYWTALGVIAAVVVAVAVAVAVALSRWVVRPLLRVEQAAEEIGAGNLDLRAPVEGPPEVRRLAETFNSMVTRLDVLMRSQDEFVADASHQLRTPLTALRLRLENLERDVNAEGLQGLAGALAEVERLAALVDALLVLARADRTGPSPQLADVGAAITDRCDAWTPLTDERGVELDARLEGPLTALVTPGRLEQVLDNLLANALEASPPGGTITVSARSRQQSVELHVTDEGLGMSPEQRARAFDRFWRGGRDGDGFGLGLAVVHRLVTADGGTVELRRSATGGLDAVVRLPAGVAASALPPQPVATAGEV